MTTTQLTDRDLPTSHDPSVLAELVDACKQFGKGSATVQAVRGLDLQVRAGELLALLGPNGAGKSTAVGMLTGLTARPERHGSSVATPGTCGRGGDSA